MSRHTCPQLAFQSALNTSSQLRSALATRRYPSFLTTWPHPQRGAAVRYRSSFIHLPRGQTKYQTPFKSHRQRTLQEDRDSDDPLFAESYPRLEEVAERKSVPDFLDDFHENLVEKPVELVGRVRSVRVSGQNLIFLDIVNEFQKVQVMLNSKRCLPEKHAASFKFAVFRNIVQIGDHISVIGSPVRTRAGEPTLQAHELPKLLAPSMEQIPQKLTDVKSRMQERHVDMLVNKDVVEVLRLRSEITKYLRDHLQSKRFLEFQTPIIAENAGGAIARPFVTRATEFRNKDMALRVAPELWLKRLVVGGIDKVFEIGPAFRNEGIDATHNPEFTTCEFYSAYSNLADLIRETEELLCGMAHHAKKLIETQLTSLPAVDVAKFDKPFNQVEFVPGLEEALGFRLPNLSSPDALSEMVAVLKLKGKAIPGEVPTTLVKLLDRLAALHLEPLSQAQPFFITNHPACMSPLAKSFLCPKTYQLISARAELFVGGRELANMYEEENDPEEQKRKLLAHRRLVNKEDGSVGFDEASEEGLEESAYDRNDEFPEEAEDYEDGVEERESSLAEDEDAPPLDKSFIGALEYGLPPTGGWGCGVERLVMLFSGAKRISDCLSFGTLQHVVGVASEEDKKEAAANALKRGRRMPAEPY